MYLKRLELVGFKSFANKTRLEFEPGMTAIVGPNGCGKSNVSDAVRWVLGEQRARVLRGAKMEDVIFNGADSKRPLGMAEVSLTLADCSSALGVEYDEVCITRRVFRSGESGYFLNRKGCRLKDIQRLFMDTGVGTDSYSILEQGKIDQILSARPEDRRAVFEEASGITKYKADKKEALRKLEQTEANLLRLTDVISEVKRQIGSLQRQAGKARRYKALSAEMRALDLYVTNAKLMELSRKMNECCGALQILERDVRVLQEAVEQAEERTRQTREKMVLLEESIAQGREQVATLHGTLEQTRNLISMNKDRIAELRGLVERNRAEVTEASARRVEEEQKRDVLLEKMTKARAVKESFREQLDVVLAEQKQVDKRWEEVQAALGRLRTELLEREEKMARSQNELNELDAQDRTALLKKERLGAEKMELERACALFSEQLKEIQVRAGGLKKAIELEELEWGRWDAVRVEKEQGLKGLERSERERAKMLASKQARIEILSQGAARQAGFPPGAQRMMEAESVPRGFLGPLVEQITVPKEYQLALEAVLRPCLDALVVEDAACAMSLLLWLKKAGAGSARLVHLDGVFVEHPAFDAGVALVDLLEFDLLIDPVVRRLFGGVYVVEDDFSATVPAGIVVVSKAGLVLDGSGSSELWMPATKDKSPLARHQLCEQLKRERDALELEVKEAASARAALEKEGDVVRTKLAGLSEKMAGLRRDFAGQEGEQQVVQREMVLLKERLNRLCDELRVWSENQGAGTESRDRLVKVLKGGREEEVLLRKKIGEQTQMLSGLEQSRAAALTKTTERQIAFSEKSQELAHLLQQQAPLEGRIRELQQLIKERESGIEAYRLRVEKLTVEMEEKSQRIAPLEEQLKETADRLAENRSKRGGLQEELSVLEARWKELRITLAAEAEKKAQLELERAEVKMRHENMLDRVLGAYHITKEELKSAEPPEWEKEGEELPACSVLEVRMAEVQRKLTAMGPVNLVAIEEHAELEERYAFLHQQQTDLVGAKTQLLEMIHSINATTTELFKKTFDLVNANFQTMFKTLFGGGSAKLVLTDEADVLESGIDIIARPPGKKLQSISLLSGGERTMTAVALLFSLFKVRPSPFCVLDELDAALDDANINRFVSTLKAFLEHSQFIIITHSRQTIAAADIIYGVTMQTRGVSKIVSMKFSDYHHE